MACQPYPGGFFLVALLLGVCCYSSSLAENNGTDDAKISHVCAVRSVNVTSFIDTTPEEYPCQSGQCRVILNVTWTQPRNLSCISQYIVKIERIDTQDDSLGSGNYVYPSFQFIQEDYKCTENYTVPVEASATYRVLSSDLDVPLWTHCVYNVSVITQGLDDDFNTSVSVVKTTTKLDNRAPKLHLQRQEWFPLPDGKYSLQADFFIDNFIHQIVDPLANMEVHPSTCPCSTSCVTHFELMRTWDHGPDFKITATVNNLGNLSCSYLATISISIYTHLDVAVSTMLAVEPLKIQLEAPALPPGPVQNLTVTTGVQDDGTAIKLSVQWSVPAQPYTTGRLEYDASVTSGGNSSFADGLTDVYHVQNTGLNTSVEANGTEWILVSVRAVSDGGNFKGNWTDVNFTVDANDPSTVPPPLITINYLVLYILLPAVIVMTIVCLVATWLVCVCRHYCQFWRHRRYYRKTQRGRKRGEEKSLDTPFSLETIFASGHFGRVFNARLPDDKDQERHGVVDDRVAVKVIFADEDTKADVQREIDVLCSLKRGDCSNVVKMLDYGWIICEGRLEANIVMELVEYGSLVEYLRWSGAKIQDHPVDHDNPLPVYEALGPVSADDQLHFAVQISNGMEFISNCEIVHCDLACRNVLLGKGSIVKIADFGLAQKGSVCQLHQTELPYRWMAPEAITTKQVSTKTDVWSFGVTLWEIWSYGEIPMSHLTNEEVIAAAFVSPDCILKQPLDCRMDVWSVILECWDTNQGNRPEFSELTENMDNIRLEGKLEDA